MSTEKFCRVEEATNPSGHPCWVVIRNSDERIIRFYRAGVDADAEAEILNSRKAQA